VFAAKQRGQTKINNPYICDENQLFMNQKTTWLVLVCLIGIFNIKVLHPQEVPHNIKNYGVYDFIDELANSRIITINSVVKPYSRMLIAQKLIEAGKSRDKLNPRQQKELDFYLRDFRKEVGDEAIEAIAEIPQSGMRRSDQSGDSVNGKKEIYFLNIKTADKKRIDLFYYRDSLFSITVNPILGGEIFNNSAGNATYWRNGFEARAYIGKWGFYASLRDNHEKPLLGAPEYLTTREGGHVKDGTDWSEMQGGVTYAWKWGDAGMVKDNIEWGNNYHDANIYGGNNPTFIQFRLHLNPVKWFDFNYFHGWMNSMVVDSNRSYWVTNSYGTDYREVYHKKFIAANMFTFTPFKNLNLSAGNSIVYADLDAFPAYLMPMFFYKSVDHSVNSGIDNMNSQMFFDISSRQIRNLHLYATLFVDELSVSRISEDDEWNFVSWKAGFRLSNFPVQNLSLTTEFNYSYPLTYQHYVPTLTFESNNYNIGHYLRDNSREWYVSLDYRPIRAMNINLFFLDAIRGPDYTELGGSRVGNPPLETVEWHNRSAGLKAAYQLINDLYFWANYTTSNIRGDERWSPEYFFGKKNTINAGVTFGF
jgi:hypothetical protein